LSILIAITTLVIGSDIWVVTLVQYQAIPNAAKISEYILVIMEMLIKLSIFLLLIAWRFRSNKENEKDNSLIAQ
jgi:heme/copper-type cytochrome/quinol oxidase subunit 2